MAVAVPQCLLLTQLIELFTAEGGENTARTVIAVDGVLVDALADDIGPFEHHAAKHIGGMASVAVFDDVNIPAVGVNHLTAVAATGAPADAGGFQYHHVVTGFSKEQSRRETGKTCADNADIALNIVGQFRPGLVVIGIAGVIAVDVRGTVNRGQTSDRSTHVFILLSVPVVRPRPATTRRYFIRHTSSCIFVGGAHSPESLNLLSSSGL